MQVYHKTTTRDKIVYVKLTKTELLCHLVSIKKKSVQKGVAHDSNEISQGETNKGKLGLHLYYFYITLTIKTTTKNNCRGLMFSWLNENLRTRQS